MKKQRIAATSEMAAAALDDLRHIKEILKRPEVTAGDVRRISGIARRLLTDKGGDLLKVAAPRVGRILIRAPDNKAFYVASRKGPLQYFVSGGIELMGVRARAAYAGTQRVAFDGHDPDGFVDLPLDNFLKQNVLCIDGRWATRRAAVLFISYVASGVHSGSPGNDEEQALAKLRSALSFGLRPPFAAINFDIAVLRPGYTPLFTHHPDRIDCVSYEMLATGYFAATSPDVLRLEEVIKAEQAAG